MTNETGELYSLLSLFWNGRPDRGVQLEPGIHVVHADVDGVTGTATIRLRRRRGSTS